MECFESNSGKPVGILSSTQSLIHPLKPPTVYLKIHISHSGTFAPILHTHRKLKTYTVWYEPLCKHLYAQVTSSAELDDTVT